MGTTNIPKIPPTDYRVDIRNLSTSAETAKNIRNKERLGILNGRYSERNVSDHFQKPSENAGDIQN